MKFSDYEAILLRAMGEKELSINNQSTDRIKNTLDFSEIFDDKQRDNPDDLDYVTGVIHAFVAIIAEETRDSQVDPDSDTMLVWLHDAVAGLEGSAEEETAPPDVRGVPIPGYIPYVDMDDEQQDLVRSMGEWSAKAPVAIYGIQNTYAEIVNTGLPDLMAALHSAEALVHHTGQAAIVSKGSQPVTVVQAPQNGGKAEEFPFHPGQICVWDMDSYVIEKNAYGHKIEFWRENRNHAEFYVPFAKNSHFLEDALLPTSNDVHKIPLRVTFEIGNRLRYKQDVPEKGFKAGDLKPGEWVSGWWKEIKKIERLDE